MRIIYRFENKITLKNLCLINQFKQISSKLIARSMIKISNCITVFQISSLKDFLFFRFFQAGREFSKWWKFFRLQISAILYVSKFLNCSWRNLYKRWQMSIMKKNQDSTNVFMWRIQWLFKNFRHKLLKNVRKEKIKRKLKKRRNHNE